MRRFANKHFLGNGSGFSLVELIIVVAVLGILAAIAIPAYQGYITAGKERSARAVLEQFPILIETHRAETGRMCPTCNVTGTHTYAFTDSDAIKAIYPDFRPKGNLDEDSLYDYRLDIQVTAGVVSANATAIPDLSKGAPPGNILYRIE